MIRMVQTDSAVGMPVANRLLARLATVRESLKALG